MDRYMSRALSSNPSREFDEEDDDSPDLLRAASSCSSGGPSTFFAQSTSVVSEQWKRATSMLTNHPSLMTNRILCMALKHRPPSHIVHCMLQLNPSAADVQHHDTPTALQVALQSQCSVLVIEALIQACPLALVERTVLELGNGRHVHLDPLSYAKRYRGEEHELIRVLSLPLSHWMEKQEQQQQQSGWNKCSPTKAPHSPPTRNYPGRSSQEPSTEDPFPEPAMSDLELTPPRSLRQPTIMVSPEEEEAEDDEDDIESPVTVASLAGMSATVTSLMRQNNDPPMTLGAAPRPSSVRWASPIRNLLQPSEKYDYGPPPRNRNVEESQEVANVKLICMAVLRGHRRLTAQLKSLAEESQHRVVIPAELFEHLEEMEQEILRKVEQNTDEQLRSQLIALDMKEQHICANLYRLERKVVRKVAMKQQLFHEEVVHAKVNKVIKVAGNRIMDCQERLDRMERLLLQQQRERKLQEKKKREIPREVTVEPHSAARDTRDDLTGTLLDNGDRRVPPAADGLLSPVVFRSPLTEVSYNDNGDEVRSLLTGDGSRDAKKAERKKASPRNHSLKQLLCKI